MYFLFICFFFFFSSRRRHTRWPRDWSSDVCSSDLYGGRRQNAPIPLIDPDGRDAQFWGGNILGRWTHLLAGGGETQLQAYYDRTQRTILPLTVDEKRNTFEDRKSVV